MSMWVHLKASIAQFTWREWCVVACIVLGAFLRFYRLDNAMFQGDQGRDALIVSRIFTERDLVFIGPVTSIGNMYLGPFYYYFMAPWLFLTYPSPIGPVIAVATLSVILLACTYWLGQELVGKSAALVATILLTFSTVMIDASRFSWNPNPAPLVGFLLLYSTFKATRDPRFWIAAAICGSILLQLHYVTLLGCAASGLLWLVSAFRIHHTKDSQKFWYATCIALFICIAFFAPLFLFDAKHQWLNLQAAQKIVSSSENFGYAGTTEKILTTVHDVDNQLVFLIFKLLVRDKAQGAVIPVLTTLTIIGAIVGIRTQKSKELGGVATVVLFVCVTAFGLAAYRHSIFIHYVIFCMPAATLLFGWCSTRLYRMHRALVAVPILSTAMIVALQQPHYSFAPAGPTFAQLEHVAHMIQSNLNPQERYIVILLSESHDILGMNYRYFLSADKKKRPLEPGMFDADTLVVINEEKKTQTPQDLPIYEIVTFPAKTPDKVIRSETEADVYIFRRKPQD